MALDPFIAQLQATLARHELELHQAKVGMDLDGAILSGIRKAELDALGAKHDAEINHMLIVALADRVRRTSR